jgi:hypothetical protein
MVKVKTPFTVLLMVSLLGIAACSDDDDDADADAGGTTTETGTTGKEGGEPILIKTHLPPLNARGEQVGEVRSGSTIGDSAFCAGGKFADAPGEPPVVVRTFRCPGGTLTITFSPKPDQALKQSSDWEVVKGLRSFEGLSGGGRMRALFESNGDEGRETFAGTVTR